MRSSIALFIFLSLVFTIIDNILAQSLVASSTLPSVQSAASSAVSVSSSAAAAADDAADFGTVQQMVGNMDRTDVDFIDGLAVDVLSPRNRTFMITQNKNHLDGKFVTGSTGENFQALLPYSYVVELNETANDLIGKLELPFDPTQLQASGFDPADTYVAKLAADGKSWMIMENQRNVHRSENKTRIIKMTSLEGEFLLLGRKDIDNANIFVQYGLGETRTANFSGGPGRQEAEFIDGLRFSVEANAPLRMNVQLRSPVDGSQMLKGMQLLNSFSYVVNTTATRNASVVRKASIEFPINRALVEGGRAQAADMKFVIVRRELGATNGTFQAITNGTLVQVVEGKARVEPGTKLDGEYVVLLASNASGQFFASDSSSFVSGGTMNRAKMKLAAMASWLVCVLLMQNF